MRNIPKNSRRTFNVLGLLLAIFLIPTAASAVSGGTPASSEAPWAVQIVTDEGGLCTGSVIDSRHVLTARHCVAGQSQFDVAVGGQTLSTTTVASAKPSVGDLAILTLPDDAGVAPVRIAPNEEFVDRFTDQGVTFFGWGNTEIRVNRKGHPTGGSRTPAASLQKTPDGAYKKARFCQSFFGPYASCFLKTNTLSADGVAVLQGDSGGPWVGWDGGWTLIAVERGGISEIARSARGPEGGANVGHPVVQAWIASIVNPGDPSNRSDCKSSAWKSFGFRNQGACIGFVGQGGTLGGGLIDPPGPSATITFDEYPVGSVISEQYRDLGLVVGGDDPVIAQDGAIPTSPVLSGQPIYQGDIELRFYEANADAPITASGISFDIGYLDVIGGVVITSYDTSGAVVEEIETSHIGVTSVSLTRAGVHRVMIDIKSIEPAGATIDNLKFVLD